MSQQDEFSKANDLLRDLTQLGQFDQTFSFPGKDKTYKIRIGTLWEDDYINVKKRAAEQSNDPGVQSEIILLETLVAAILTVDGYNFYHDDDIDQHNLKKGLLRELLKKASPYTILSLYKKYSQLTTMGADAINERIEEIKKSSGPSQPGTTTPPSTID